ncbi:MAG: DUF2147 domain-containing protein [Rhizobiaceae bacterium]
MNRTVKIIAGAATLGFVLATTGAAFAAEPIVGTWVRKNGTKIRYSGSGTKFCGTVVNKKYKGKSIGCMSGTKGKYKGKVIALDEGKTYRGKAIATGSKLRLSGCVAVFCKTETLRRIK